MSTPDNPNKIAMDLINEHGLKAAMDRKTVGGKSFK